MPGIISDSSTISDLLVTMPTFDLTTPLDHVTAGFDKRVTVYTESLSCQNLYTCDDTMRGALPMYLNDFKTDRSKREDGCPFA